jgi:hypothetical protein
MYSYELKKNSNNFFFLSVIQVSVANREEAFREPDVHYPLTTRWKIAILLPNPDPNPNLNLCVGTMKYYQDLIRKISVSKAGKEAQERAVRNKLKQDVWEQVCL